MGKAVIGTFDKLVAWQEAHKLTLLVYKVSDSFPKSEQFNLTAQLRRAAVSIESCIAEGFYRYHYKDRLNFFYDARGSLGEVQSQIRTAKDVGFVHEKEFQRVIDQTEKTGAVLGGLIRSTNSLVKR